MADVRAIMVTPLTALLSVYLPVLSTTIKKVNTEMFSHFTEPKTQCQSKLL